MIFCDILVYTLSDFPGRIEMLENLSDQYTVSYVPIKLAGVAFSGFMSTFKSSH